MDQLNKLGYQIGFSDHTIGSSAAIAAVAKGATIIEKHITLDKNMEGPDHKASLSVNEFYKMINNITAYNHSRVKFHF